MIGPPTEKVFKGYGVEVNYHKLIAFDVWFMSVPRCLPVGLLNSSSVLCLAGTPFYGPLSESFKT